MQITIPRSLRKATAADKKVIINSDSVWAFTEQPRNIEPVGNRKQIAAHELFDLFTGSIIRQKTRFTR